VSEEDLDDRLRMTFLIHSETSFCRWLVMFGNAVEIESPSSLKEAMATLVEELALHYRTVELKA
jgi:predicted DNA-binding transcriptional regulator YafY